MDMSKVRTPWSTEIAALLEPTGAGPTRTADDYFRLASLRHDEDIYRLGFANAKTEDAALLEALQQLLRHFSDGEYACPLCGAWNTKRNPHHTTCHVFKAKAAIAQATGKEN